MEKELVYQIDSVTARIGKSTLEVHSEGQARTAGYTDQELVAQVYKRPPIDGIQEFHFVAKKPSIITIDVLTPIQADASIPLEPWVKGVRVFSATNSVEALLGVGSVMVAPPGSDSVTELAAFTSASANSLRVPEVIVYEHWHFQGNAWRTNLCWNLGDEWNDKISSIIVVSGTWAFCEHHNYGGWRRDLGPGYYNYVENFGIPNDQISSFGFIA